VPGALDEKLIERALALIIESESAPQDAAAAARLARARWRSRSATHAAAAQEARRRWDALGGIAAELRDSRK